MKYNKNYYLQQKVQFEDCDLQGIVHHPKLFCYLERARISALADEDIKYQDMLREEMGFVLSDINIRFSQPLKLGQSFWITTKVVGAYKNYLKLHQTISLDKITEDHMKAINPICYAKLRVCIVNTNDISPINESHTIFKKLDYNQSKNTLKDIMVKHPYL
ncbi:hypothetical protein CPAV1605_1351 [seawater metagenome]|uniref:Thioesterase superfamily n=1 Tax=seawater metagenome TaxID=1561972 RepID=A0A5E8CL73_9ZZZZ